MPWLNVRKADPKRCKYTDNSRRVHPGYEKRYPSYKRQHEGT